MADGFLHRYFLNNPGKRLHKWTHYFDIYERHFERFRGMSPVLLEIGVWGGGSLAMWQAYFGPGATIIGLDNDPACSKHGGNGIWGAEWSGGVKVPGTFMEFTKDKLDELNATYTGGAIPISPFTTSTSHIVVYDVP